jgi:hypothetical protein
MKLVDALRARFPRTADVVGAARAAFPVDEVWAAVDRVEAYALALPSLAEVAATVREDLRADAPPVPVNRRRAAPVFRHRSGASQSGDRRTA